MRKFEVLKVEGKSGLTLGAKVLAPNKVFTENDWPYGEESLEAAIKNKRCREIIEGKEEPKKAEALKEEAPATDEQPAEEAIEEKPKAGKAKKKADSDE